MKTVTILYFAALKEQANRAEETMQTAASTAYDLYAELTGRYGFTLKPEHMRVAINDVFKTYETPLQDKDQIAFIPPISGG